MIRQDAPVDLGEKGGRGSGNWGHVGRPGKRGGSQRGSGGAHQRLESYLGAYRNRLRPIRDTVLRPAIEKWILEKARDRGEELSEDELANDVRQTLEVISLNPEAFGRHAKRMGFEGVNANDYFKEDVEAERAVMRRRMEVMDRATLSTPDGRPSNMVKQPDLGAAPLIGKDAAQAADALKSDFGVDVIFERRRAPDYRMLSKELTPDEQHKALSELHALLTENPTARAIAHRYQLTARIEPGYRDALAEAIYGNTIKVYYAGANRSTWLHELSHLADGLVPAAELSLFGKGRQTSSYGWRNELEGWAEWSAAYFAYPHEQLRAWDPRKFAIVERIINRVTP